MGPRRPEPAEPVGGSSGPKDYVKNAVWSVFSDQPAVRRVLFVRSAGALFLLMLRAEGWFDIARRPRGDRGRSRRCCDSLKRGARGSS